MWEKLDNKLLICYALTTLAGIGLHFVFDLWPSLLTEFFAPSDRSREVAESALACDIAADLRSASGRWILYPCPFGAKCICS